MFFSKPKAQLGIDFGAGGIKLVELKEEKKRPVLFTYGFSSGYHDVHELFVPLPESSSTTPEIRTEDKNAVKAATTVDPSKDEARIVRYAELIKEVCKQAKVISKTAVVSLPVSAVFHTLVTLPLVKKEELDRFLKSEVKKLLPYPLEEAALDYEILPSPPESKVLKILVNAVPRSLVLFYSKVFQRAGLRLLALEPESVALSRSLIGRDAVLSMLVDIGAERTNFFIVDATKPIAHQSIETGGVKINKVLQDILGADAEMTEQLKRDLFDHLLSSPGQTPLGSKLFTELFLSVIDPIIKKIEYSFDMYLRQTGNEGKHPEKIILTGGGAYLPYLAQYIAEYFKVKCYLGDPWGRVVYQEGLKPVLSSIGPRMSVAIGLALKGMGAT